MRTKFVSKFWLRLRVDRIKSFDEIENMKNQKFFIPLKTRSFEGQRFSKVQIPEAWNLGGI